MVYTKNFTYEELFGDFIKWFWKVSYENSIYTLSKKWSSKNDESLIIINTETGNISCQNLEPFELLFLNDLIIKLGLINNRYNKTCSLLQDTGLEIKREEVTLFWDCTDGTSGSEEYEEVKCPYCDQLLIDKDSGFDYTDVSYCPTCGGRIKGWDK